MGRVWGNCLAEHGPVGHSTGCVTLQAEKGATCGRASLVSPTLLAEAWFQNGLIAGDVDTLFILACLAHTLLPRRQAVSVCLSSSEAELSGLSQVSAMSQSRVKESVLDPRLCCQDRLSCLAQNPSTLHQLTLSVVDPLGKEAMGNPVLISHQSVLSQKKFSRAEVALFSRSACWEPSPLLGRAFWFEKLGITTLL